MKYEELPDIKKLPEEVIKQLELAQNIRDILNAKKNRSSGWIKMKAPSFPVD